MLIIKNSTFYYCSQFSSLTNIHKTFVLNLSVLKTRVVSNSCFAKYKIGSDFSASVHTSRFKNVLTKQSLDKNLSERCSDLVNTSLNNLDALHVKQGKKKKFLKFLAQASVNNQDFGRNKSNSQQLFKKKIEMSQFRIPDTGTNKLEFSNLVDTSPQAKEINSISANKFNTFNSKKNISSSYSKLHELKLINIGLASSERIKQWAEKTLPNGKIIGQVTNANTLHHKTLKPQKGGLFCERIFGPLKDFECACGKNQKPSEAKQQKIFEHQELDRIFCIKCDVEYTWSVIRRYQLGYIQLVSPVTHPWYLKATPSYLSILLDMKKRHLEYIIYSSETLTLEYSQKLTEQQYNSPSNLFKIWQKSIKNVNKTDLNLQSVNTFEHQFILPDTGRKEQTNILTVKPNDRNFLKLRKSIKPKRFGGWRKLIFNLTQTSNNLDLNLNIFNNFDKYYQSNKNNKHSQFKKLPILFYILKKIKNSSIKKSVTFLNDDLFRAFYIKIYQLAYKKINNYLPTKISPIALSLPTQMKTTQCFKKKFRQLQHSTLPMNETFEKERIQKIFFYKKVLYKLLTQTKFFRNNNFNLMNTPSLIEKSKPNRFKNNFSNETSITNKFISFLKFELNIFSKKFLQTNFNILLILKPHFTNSLGVYLPTQFILSKKQSVHTFRQGKERVELSKLPNNIYLLLSESMHRFTENNHNVKNNSFKNQKSSNLLMQNNSHQNQNYVYCLKINQIGFLICQTLVEILFKKLTPIINLYLNKVFRLIIQDKCRQNVFTGVSITNDFCSFESLASSSLSFRIPAILEKNSLLLNSLYLRQTDFIGQINNSIWLKTTLIKKLTILSEEFKNHNILFLNNLILPDDKFDRTIIKGLSNYLSFTQKMNQEVKSFNLSTQLSSSFSSSVHPYRDQNEGIINNIYCLSHRYRWSTEKDWKQFIDYLGTVPELNDNPIPFYKNRVKNAQNLVNGTGITGTFLIKKLLEDFNFTELKKIDKQNRILLYELNKNLIRLKRSLKQTYGDRHKKKMFKELYNKRDALIRRTKLIRKLFRKNSTPGSMILSILPVLPPDLRPIIKVGGQIAASDLNRLYQRVIYRNERLKKFLKDPATINSYEMKYAQRLLQEAVDNLIQNGNSGLTAEKDSKGRLLKSLSDVLKGKQGRFRQHLLGKRVDYSGRSVIVVGPKLKLYECGLPKEMALELFLPFIIKKVIALKLARTVIGAKTLIKNNKELTDDILREIMSNHPILLNRAPTLHRLGIQAFQPKLVDGRAILLHPLVCPAFNADFDGDQMAVHVPITVEARTEAWKLMFSRNNLLSPATGEPIVLPSQDMVLGCYYLTTENIKANLTRKIYFSNLFEVLKLYKQGKINVHTIIWVRYEYLVETGADTEEPIEIRITNAGYWQEIYKKILIRYDFEAIKISQFIKTTPGRILFNELITESIQLKSNLLK